MMENGFEEANSNNLPSVDFEMVTNYTSDNVSAEWRGHKDARSSRKSYGDEAIGYVQLKREGATCTIKALITPEHRVTKGQYSVTTIIDEENSNIVSSNCKNCAAAEGGCKHALAFVFWLHRRSEEPSVTEVLAYWKKSQLSKVGSSKKFIKVSEMVPSSYVETSSNNTNFLDEIVSRIKNTNSILLNHYKEFTDVEKLSIHHMYLVYKNEKNHHTCEGFLKYCSKTMSAVACRDAEQLTKNQSKCPAWYELRYARVTASKIYEASRCKTSEGSLIETIFGATKSILTDAMKRGQDLEAKVLKQLSKTENLNIQKCGLQLFPELPFLGASPDGLTETYCIEVKCPAKLSTVTNYVKKDGSITSKFYSQIQIQMHLCNKRKGLFVVADPDFENNSKYTKVEVLYDQVYCINLINDTMEFWKNYVFPVLNKI